MFLAEGGNSRGKAGAEIRDTAVVEGSGAWLFHFQVAQPRSPCRGQSGSTPVLCVTSTHSKTFVLQSLGHGGHDDGDDSRLDLQ